MRGHRGSGIVGWWLKLVFFWGGSWRSHLHSAPSHHADPQEAGGWSYSHIHNIGIVSGLTCSGASCCSSDVMLNKSLPILHFPVFWGKGPRLSVHKGSNGMYVVLPPVSRRSDVRVQVRHTLAVWVNSADRHEGVSVSNMPLGSVSLNSAGDPDSPAEEFVDTRSSRHCSTGDVEDDDLLACFHKRCIIIIIIIIIQWDYVTSACVDQNVKRNLWRAQWQWYFLKKPKYRFIKDMCST